MVKNIERHKGRLTDEHDIIVVTRSHSDRPPLKEYHYEWRFEDLDNGTLALAEREQIVGDGDEYGRLPESVVEDLLRNGYADTVADTEGNVVGLLEIAIEGVN